MKKFKIPKIIRRIELSEYAPEYEEHFFDVWVNPSREERGAFSANIREIERLKSRIIKLGTKPKDAPDDWKPNEKEIDNATSDIKRLDEKILEWWAYIWSQGDDKKNHCSVDEVREFMEECEESDLGLWMFVTRNTSQMIFDHAAGVKKK